MRLKWTAVIQLVAFLTVVLLVLNFVTTTERRTVRRVETRRGEPKETTNTTGFLSPLNGIMEALPHLTDIGQLEPDILLGKPSKKKLLIAIPAVERIGGSYLMKTLNSITKWMDETDREQLSIMVFVRSENDEFAASTAKRIEETFSSWGLWSSEDPPIQVLHVPRQLQPPDLASITPTFNDTVERMLWRTRQNIDYMYVMSYGSQFGDYVLLLEDDLYAQKDCLRNILFLIKVYARKQWLIMEFAMEGFLSKLFRAEDARRFTRYIGLYYNKKPVDWLLTSFIKNHICHPEKQKQCYQDIFSQIQRYLPSQFNHIGYHSSLPGKIQKIKELGFGGTSKKIKKSYMAANLDTNMTRLQAHSPADMWNFPVFFHAKQPQVSETLTVTFEVSTTVQAILITSGTYTLPENIFESDVEVLAVSYGIPKTLGQFGNDGRFEKMLDCEPLDEVIVRVNKEASRDVVLTNIHIVPC